jgi:RNA-directed DNA polymerase
MSVRPAIQLWLPFSIEGEVFMEDNSAGSPSGDECIMEQVVERENLLQALKQVKKNGGSPGIDGMTVEELPDHLREKWRHIKESLLQGAYQPKPVKRTEIPKPQGGKRKLGIPTVLDRFIQQSLLQVLQREWDLSFSESSYGFRPRRNAHQAVRRAQKYLKEGRTWVVDLDLEKFFDRVNHDKLMSEVSKRIKDKRVIGLIWRYLKAGVMEHDALHETVEGTPQGGPLSPLLSNLLLDRFDKELERRGHCFVRYADDCNIYVRSKRAGGRVLRSITDYLDRQLKLRVNEAKSAVGRPWKRKFLGFTFSGRDYRLKISDTAVKRFKDRVRVITRRTRGRRIEGIAKELRGYLLGWKAYFGVAEVQSPRKELNSWVKRKLRCYLWKQWGRRGYKELRKRGVSRDLAWNTCKSAHGPWRLSRSPALAFALPASYFASLGVPSIFVKRPSQPNRLGT